MSKSFKFKNDNYLDAKGIVINKVKLSDKFINGTSNDWSKTIKVSYTLYRPRIIFISWGAIENLVVYVVYCGRVVLLNRIGTSTINVSNDKTNKIITFTTSETMICSVLDI